jgi:hypothetical protein
MLYRFLHLSDIHFGQEKDGTWCTVGSAVSIPFSLRAELKGVDAAPGVTLRYWEAGAGRALVMLPGLGHAASLYKYQLEGLCDDSG